MVHVSFQNRVCVEMATLSINLVVDKEKNRVLFAEADEDFVDVLFSFLTLPLGTVARVLGRKLTLGCVDRLYESVQNLDTKYLETEACKKMLLEPRSEAEILCEDLKLNVYDLKPRRLYRCPTFECVTKTHRLYSSVSGARCPCGKAMDKHFQYCREQVSDGGNIKDGVFVKGGKRYIITDDLHVRPVYSMESTLSIFGQHGIEDSKAFETKKVDIGRDEILNLLTRLLISATPLTDILLLKLDPMKDCSVDQEVDQLKDITRIKSKDNTTTAATAKTIQLKLLYNEVSKKVLSAQAGEDFVDILFSFLTFPLGCIVNLLEGNSSIICLDNLYKSIECSGGELDYIKSEENKNLLLAPELYSHFGISNQLLEVEEKASFEGQAHGCEYCWINKGIITPENMCEKHNIAVVDLTEVNPKLPSSGTECGGGYAKKSVRYMITDEMVVTPLSSISGIDAIKKSKATISSLVERDVTLGEIEVLRLLKACLVSRVALNNVFPCTKRKRILHDYLS